MALFDFTQAASDPNNPNAQMISPEEATRRRALADALVKQGSDYSPVRSPWQGAARLAQGLLGGYESRDLDKQQKGQESSIWASLLGGGTPAATGATAAATPSTAPASSGSSLPMMASGGPDKDAFVAALMPKAMEASKVTGIDPRLIIAQGALESGYGAHAPGNNLFGIKGTGPAGSNNLATTEVVNGQPVQQQANFRAYASPADSVNGYASFIMNNPRYAPMRNAEGLDAQVAALGKSGYATDPNYAAKVGAIARGLQVPGAPAAPAGVPSIPGAPQVASANPGFVPQNPAGAPPAAAAVPPAAAPQKISVPGYDGTFSRDQANDGDGIPSQAEWDAAAKASGGSPAPAPVQVAQAGTPAPASAPAAPAPPMSPRQQIGTQQLMQAIQYGNTAQKQIATLLLQKQMSGTAYGAPTTLNGNFGQYDSNGQWHNINAAKDQTDKTPTSVLEYQFAQKNGYGGSFTDWQQQGKAQTNHVLNQGAILTSPNGSVLAKNDSQPRNARSAIGLFMNKFLEENPNASAEEIQKATQGFQAGQSGYSRFTSGPQGNTVRSFNVLVDHLGTLNDAADSLDNGNTKVFNQVAQKWAEQTGQPAPTNFDATKALVGDEIIKAVVGAGGSLADREEAKAAISRSNSPAQLKGVIDQYRKLAVGQLHGLRDQYKAATNRDDFDHLLSPGTKTFFESPAKAPPVSAAPTSGVGRVVDDIKGVFGFGAPAAAAPAPKLQSKADYDALPSGARFVAPDGSTRVKP